MAAETSGMQVSQYLQHLSTFIHTLIIQPTLPHHLISTSSIIATYPIPLNVIKYFLSRTQWMRYKIINMIVMSSPAAMCTGLGALAVLSDELLSSILSLLPAKSLARSSLASKSLYCFCNHEDLWRVLVLEVTLLTQLGQDPSELLLNFIIMSTYLPHSITV